MSRPSPALVLAVLAVVLAVGGADAAVAGARTVIDGRSIKAGTVSSKQVKDGSLTGKDLKAGSLTPTALSPAVLQSLAGPAGPTGPAGAPGATGVTGPAGPSTGAAGGALTGSYPDPGLAPDVVGSAQVAPNSLTGSDIDESTLTNPASSFQILANGSGVIADLGTGTLSVGCPGGSAVTATYTQTGLASSYVALSAEDATGRDYDGGYVSSTTPAVTVSLPAAAAADTSRRIVADVNFTTVRVVVITKATGASKCLLTVRTDR